MEFATPTEEILEEQLAPPDCDLNLGFMATPSILFMRKARSEIRSTSA